MANVVGRPIAALVLSTDERAYLKRQVRGRRVARSLLERCRAILRCADGIPSKSVANELGIHEHTVGKRRRRFLKDRIGIFWVLRSGARWADLPERYGPPTTIYNRFNRGRKAGVWDRLMDAITRAHDRNVQMIDTSIVRGAVVLETNVASDPDALAGCDASVIGR
jgi:transposase